jgi:DNA-binding CsgD family transcriptional regulator
LDGFDKEWSNWDNKNEKEYTNLAEGNYSFKVKAKNHLGQVSSEASYEFVILPPWYRTKLAYLTYFFFFSLSLLALLGFISRKHNKEKNVMIQKQVSELDKRDSELKSIKTKSEQEIEKLKTEKLKSDIKHKNKELATSTMHLINKNEFISHVKQNLTSLVRKNPKDPLINDLKKIMSSIERNISEDNDWKHFEMHFDQVHGDFSKRLKEKYPNLSPQDRRLCAYLRMNMTTKEIANLLNITVRGTEISRYRLRRKLGLSRETNLAEFILNF